MNTHANPRFDLEPPDDGGCIAADPDRDPRIDPQPGDILAVDRDVREVIDRVQDAIEYGFPSRAASRWLTLIRWQVWARHADVRKKAP